MLNVVSSNNFMKDIKLLKKRRYNMKKLKHVIDLIANEQILPSKYMNHLLIGNWKGYWECHISFNWVVIYKIEDNDLLLMRTGTHCDVLNF